MLSSETECLSCYEGKYCETDGLTAPTGDCNGGYFCGIGSTQATPAGNTCTQPLYCPPGSGTAINCPTGFYQDADNEPVCKECPTGFYCHSGSQQVCIAGYYCQ